MEQWEQDKRKELAKTRYFSDFALRHFNEMKILQKGGILGKENKDWRNISEHCLTEAVGADILAEYLGGNRDKVVSAALIHDWYKRKEVERMKKEGGALGYSQAAEEDVSLLRQLGVSEEIIKLAHANIPESSNQEYLNNRSLEEKIVHYIDMITSGSQFIDYVERLRIVRGKKHNIEFSESFRERYGGKSLLELQEELARIEEREFEDKLGLDRGELIRFIKEKLEERIQNYER
jgi:HD superfamily phosphodiesterase